MKMSDEYYDDDTDEEGDPQWRTLTPKERKVLLKNVFSNPDWYDEGEGTPVFQGGSANPLFQEIASKAGAPVGEIRRYYAAWLNGQGFSPAEHLKPKANTSSPVDDGPSPMMQMLTSAPDEKDPMDDITQQMMMREVQKSTQQDSGAMNMMFMMNFLTSQQKMAMQQQQFQMMQMMEQRKLDERRESDLRREAMARDQQFMNQQMGFMREMMKKSGDGDGFFDSDMKKIMKERVVDQLLGGDDNSDWKGMVKDVLGSDTLKAAVGGIGGAIGRRNPQVPAGYDVPGYNPYAQPEMAVMAAPPQSQIMQEAIHEAPIQQNPQPQQQMDGVFFDEEEPAVAEQVQPQQNAIQEINRDEYTKILFQSFTEMMGPAAQDPHVIKALQEQIDIATDVTLVEHPQVIPRIKLQKMTEKLLLIRNLRDIGQGLMDLRSRTDPGTEPSPLIMAAVVEELRKRPEFYKIFADNTYDELIAHIEPFKHTGGVDADYGYLIRSEVAEVCRPLLFAVKADAQNRGAPPIPGLA